MRVEMLHHHHHHHLLLFLLLLFLNREGRWGTTDDFATSFLHFPPFSTALWNLANSRPVHSLMLSSHLFLYLPCLLLPFTVPYKMVLARPYVSRSSGHDSLWGKMYHWSIARLAVFSVLKTMSSVLPSL